MVKNAILGFVKKFYSRKFLAAAIGAATGIGLIFGLEGDIIASVSGAILSGVSLVSYIITEGKINAEAVKKTVEDIKAAAGAIAGDDVG